MKTLNWYVLLAFVVGLLVGAATMKIISTYREPTQTLDRAEGPPLAYIREAQGTIERRTSSPDAEWTEAEPGKISTSGDSIRAADDSTAVLVLRGAGSLVMGERSMIELLEPELSEDGKRIRAIHLELQDGSMRIQAAGDADTVIRIDAGDQTIELDPGGTALVGGGTRAGQHLFSFFDSEAFLLDADGNATTIPVGHGLVLSEDSVSKPLPLPDPPQVGDEEEETKLYTEAESATAATIELDEPGMYRLVLASDPALTHVISDVVGKGASITTTERLSPGDYYWAVARLTPSRLTGQFTRTRRLRVIEGAEPVATDESPTGRISFAAGGSGTAFYTATAPEVGLDWPGLTSEDGYQVTIARDSRFRRKVATTKVSQSRYTATRLGPGSYWWRARHPDGTVHSGRFALRRISGSVPTDKSVSKISDDYDKAKIIFQRQVPPVEFVWKRDRRATGYRLNVSGTSSFTRLVASETVKVPPARLPRGRLRQGTYYWRVERLLANGTVLYPGKVHELRVLFDNTVPGLEITSPRDRARITGNTVRVAGLARPGISLSVNGRRVNVDSQGRFSASLPVDPADPRLIFQTSRGRYRTYYVREIRHAQSASQ